MEKRQDPHEEGPAPHSTSHPTRQSALPSEPELVSVKHHCEHTALCLACLSSSPGTRHTAKPLLGGFSETLRETSDHLLGVHSSTAKSGL